MQTFVRGATIIITVGFKDEAGNPVNPPSASLKLNYRAAAGRVVATLALLQNGNVWSASWDSRVAIGGAVLGHVESADPTPIAAEDFSFDLGANIANS